MSPSPRVLIVGFALLSACKAEASAPSQAPEPKLEAPGELEPASTPSQGGQELENAMAIRKHEGATCTAVCETESRGCSEVRLLLDPFVSEEERTPEDQRPADLECDSALPDRATLPADVSVACICGS
jgi:hypothetical protein